MPWRYLQRRLHVGVSSSSLLIAEFFNLFPKSRPTCQTYLQQWLPAQGPKWQNTCFASCCPGAPAGIVKSDGQGAWNCGHMLGMIRLAVCNALAEEPVFPAEMCHLLPALACHFHGMGWDVMSEAWQITHPAAAAPCCVGQGRDYLGSFSASLTGLPGQRQQDQVVTA